MEKSNSPKQIKSKIGGQAVIEGVMMRGIDKASMACRRESGEIVTEDFPVVSFADKKWYTKTPFIRGIFNLVESLTLGYKCLMKSASYIELDDGEEPTSKLEQKLTDKLGEHIMKAVTVFSSFIGVLLAVVLFMYLPALAAKGVNALSLSLWGTGLGVWRTVIEGVIKIAIFIAYLAVVSCLKDIKRLFMYHGAEHKTIACYEAGDELTPENAKKYTRFHPRCGTSFLLIVFIISIIVFMAVSWNNLLIRVLLKLALLPVVIGISYEIIRLAGKYDNVATRIISAPGLCLQRLTTREPDEGQLEVAITALKAVMPENREQDRWDM